MWKIIGCVFLALDIALLIHAMIKKDPQDILVCALLFGCMTDVIFRER